ncbi:MAG: ASKHA domain-containing protein [Candidatus Brocadia sp.]|nr:ASKHA domain-containing protein [Candidatus Brocadia sp.]
MTESAQITFYPLKITGMVPKGVTILEAARSLGVDIEGPCGGIGKCGRDLVQVRTGGILTTVLACKTHMETDLEVFLPSHEKETLKIVEGFYAEGNRTYSIDPSIKKDLMHDEHGLCSTKVYGNDNLLLLENGDTKDQTYGIAVDIGTTTLVASLVDLNSGEVLNGSSTLNPLVYYGHDVMSRIKYAGSQRDSLLRMHRELISAVNLLIRILSSEGAVRPENIYQIIAAGNTTMQHIFLNKGIRGLGEYPYQAETLDPCTTTARELSLDIAANAPVTTFPCISAYVGGDIVSGLLAIDIKSIEVPALFLDIGTNGEIALILNGGIIASSTAAGPCFEGMTISSGMRAGKGAIEHVRFENELSLEVIGGGQPRGICGSGLLDLVSELVRIGLVNSRGRMLVPDNENKLFDKDGKRYFRLINNVSISQEDIRQVQLAKAAIRAGIEILLARCNVKAEELKAIIIAGGFGYHLNEKSLFGIGLLPESINARISFVGNSSLEGAVRALLNKKLLNDAIRVARTAQVMELSQAPEFEDVFIRKMHF